MADIAVSVSNVSKDFKLPHERADSVKSLFTHPFKKRGRTETQHALKDISFQIEKGEFFGIVGRNGSGKSTLLKIIAGIYQPTKGSVNVNGRLVPFIELGVGFNPELTGRENVFLNGALMGFSQKEIKSKYAAIVDFAELERFMDQKLKNYSSGMQVRLAFSVATILAESDILLIDEVLAVGDSDFQSKCFTYFKELKRDKKTVIFVSHDMNAVKEYCDRVVLIDDSEVVTQGSANKVATAYAKLFFEKETTNQKTRQLRWGDNTVVIEKVTVNHKKVTEDLKNIDIDITIRAEEAVENPVVGFMVKNQAAQPIFGTNTKIEGTPLGELKAGETKTVTWTIPNVFAKGIHYIDPSVIEESTSRVYDWWEEAASFTAQKDKITPYIINPELKVSIKKLKN
jgi:ABC-2 type transport system ATP-binding protein